MTRVLRRLSIAAWVVAMLSFLPSAVIGFMAQAQPSEPTGEYSEPQRIREGMVRYVTPDQKFYHTLGFGGFLCGGAAFVFFTVLGGRREYSNGNAAVMVALVAIAISAA